MVKRITDCLFPLFIVVLAGIILAIIPLRVLFRKRPFHNYCVAVLLMWMKVAGLALRAIGANVNMSFTIDNA